MMAMSAACRMKQLLPPMFGPVTTSARGPPTGRPPPSPWPASPALLVAPLASGASGQRPPPAPLSSAPGGRDPGCRAGSAPPRRQQSLGTMGASVASASSTGCRPAAITSCCGSCSSTNSGRTYLRRGRQAARHWQGAQVPSRGPRLPSQVVRDPAPQQHPQQHHPRLVQPPLAQSAALHVPQQQHPAAATASRVAPRAAGSCAICGCCCYGRCCSCCACSDCCCGFCPSLAGAIKVCAFGLQACAVGALPTGSHGRQRAQAASCGNHARSRAGSADARALSNPVHLFPCAPERSVLRPASATGGGGAAGAAGARARRWRPRRPGCAGSPARRARPRPRASARTSRRPRPGSSARRRRPPAPAARWPAPTRSRPP